MSSCHAVEPPLCLFCLVVGLRAHGPVQARCDSAQIMCAISEKGERPEVPSEAPGALLGGTFPGFPAYCALMRRCWAEDPAERPSFEAVIAELRSMLADSNAHARRASGERTDKPSPLVPRLTIPGER